MDANVLCRMHQDMEWHREPTGLQSLHYDQVLAKPVLQSRLDNAALLWIRKVVDLLTYCRIHHGHADWSLPDFLLIIQSLLSSVVLIVSKLEEKGHRCILLKPGLQRQTLWLLEDLDLDCGW